MSRATFVPEAHMLSGGDVGEVLKRTGRVRLLKDSAKRFSAADGGSHSRALAHAGLLTFFPALIGVVGLATALALTTFRNVLDGTIAGLAPGPSGRILSEALHQGSKNGGTTAMVAGILAALVSGTAATAQIERGANRMYGIERDRPAVRKYLVAFLLNITAGIALIAALVLLAAGHAVADAASQTGWTSGAATVFGVARWPVGILLALAAITLILKAAPNRRQPKLSWLASGTLIATVLWLAFTALLALYFSLDKQLGQTYGPLLGIVGLLLWSYLTSIALYLGFAFAAELESRRQPSSAHAQPEVAVSIPEAERVPTAHQGDATLGS